MKIKKKKFQNDFTFEGLGSSMQLNVWQIG